MSPQREGRRITQLQYLLHLFFANFLERRLDEVLGATKVRVEPVQMGQNRRRGGRAPVGIIGFLCKDLAGS
jgi:hypothetical protein